MKTYYPTIQEFWSAVGAAKGHMDIPRCRFAQIRCLKGSMDPVLPYPVDHKFEHTAIPVAHYTLHRTGDDRVWRTTAPIIIDHPSGMFRIKRGAAVVLRPLDGAEIGFSAEDVEPYQEKVPEVRGLSS